MGIVLWIIIIWFVVGGISWAYRSYKAFCEKDCIKNKYSILINRIMNSNPNFKLQHINNGYVKISGLSTSFHLYYSLKDIKNKLNIKWRWGRIGEMETDHKGKAKIGINNIYELDWSFEEYPNLNQDEIFAIISKDIFVQTQIDSGMSREQAEEEAENLFRT